MATTVIKNTRIMQTAPPFTVNDGVDIVIVDDLIKTIGKDAGARVTADKVINGSGKTVMAAGNGPRSLCTRTRSSCMSKDTHSCKA